MWRRGGGSSTSAVLPSSTATDSAYCLPRRCAACCETVPENQRGGVDAGAGQPKGDTSAGDAEVVSHALPLGAQVAAVVRVLGRRQRHAPDDLKVVAVEAAVLCG